MMEEARDKQYEAQRKWRKQNKEKARAYHNKYLETHWDHNLEYVREWRKKNPEKAAAIAKRYQLKRRAIKAGQITTEAEHGAERE